MAKTDSRVFIEVDEIVRSKRGRKAVLDATLLDFLTGIPAGKVLVIQPNEPTPETAFGQVPVGKVRADVIQKIRKHFVAIYGEPCSVDFTPEGAKMSDGTPILAGLPQVRRKVMPSA